MTRNQAEDINWIADEVADFAVLLNSHGLDHLARKLDLVRHSLRLLPYGRASSFGKWDTPGNVIILERCRRGRKITT